jgi:integrase
LKHYIDISKWDWIKEKIKGNNPNTYQINTYINNELSKANNIIFSIQNRYKDVSFAEFERNFLNTKNRFSYYNFVEEYIVKNKNRFADSYLKQLKGEMTKLQKFRSELNFQDINYQFLSEYEYYMRNTLNNKTNTVYKTLKKMKTIINEAMRQNENLYMRSPFYNYKLKTEPTNRLYLTKQEFEILYEMRNSMSAKLNNILNYFLFSCLTGLRFQDIKDLKYKHIIEDKYIELIMHKTKERIIIPLIDKAKVILNSIDKGQTDDKILKSVAKEINDKLQSELDTFIKVQKEFADKYDFELDR